MNMPAEVDVGVRVFVQGASQLEPPLLPEASVPQTRVPLEVVSTESQLANPETARLVVVTAAIVELL